MDKPVLSPLPAERFDLSEWSRATVNIDYHIAFDTNYYRVPYNLVHELVEVRSTPTTIENRLRSIAVRNKKPSARPGALARAAGLLFTGWPGGWLRH
jgi:hypothetical protein